MRRLISVITAGKVVRVITAFAFVLVATAATGQIKVNGGFISDSVKIGEQTAFYLSARYPENAAILFPDSLYSFAPFEFQRKKYFTTDTKNGVSADSTIYYLTTFEIDPVLSLDLPVYVINERDCTVYRSNPDTIRISQLVGIVPDSIPIERLPLRINVAYHPVNYGINYVTVAIVAGVLLVLGLITWIVFGERIARSFRTRRLRRQHRTFTESYDRLSREAGQHYSPQTTESAVSLWKKYLESLESRPYTKLTSRETVRALNDQNLGKDLYMIDRAIYGHEQSVAEPLNRLRSFADTRFALKLQEVMHGK
jgi:hypothetical protein